MPRLTLALDGGLLRRQYLVYVLELTNGDHRSFYIGQTGDRKHTTARPPFRRLMAHLEDVGASTQNQLYKHIAGDILKLPDVRGKGAYSQGTKQAVEDFLVTSTIEMHVYALAPFEPDVPHEQHLKILRGVEDFERHVILLFQASGQKLGNKTFHKPRSAVLPYPEVLAEIVADFAPHLSKATVGGHDNP